MWTMTQNGFFSAVEHRDDESLLMVRCRVESDARYIAKKTGAKVKRSNGLADYEYRVTITKAQYAAFLVAETLDVTYFNFKDQIKKQQGSKRANAYMRVWSALASLQPLAPYAKVPLPAKTASGSYIWDAIGPRGGVQTNWWSDEVEGGLARLETEAVDVDQWHCPDCKLCFSDCVCRDATPATRRRGRHARRRENKRRARGRQKI